LLCLASEQQGRGADEKCRKEKSKFHGSAHPVLESPNQKSSPTER
jgi:hypothetical protein